MSEFAFEAITLLVLLAAGFSAATLLGSKNLLQALSFGLGISVIWRVMSHSLLYFIGVGEHSKNLWLVGSLVLIAIGLLKNLRNSSFYLGLGLSAVFSFTAVFLTRGLGLRGIPHSDSLWILALSDLMQRSGDMEIVGGRTAIKRGFAYPTTLALGPDGSYLTGLTPLIFMALVLAIAFAVISLSQKLTNKQWLWVLLPIGAVLVSTPIIWRAIWYVNGHTLTALGVVLSVTAVLLARQKESLSRLNLFVIMTGFALISMTRPEGVAFAAIIAAPLISRRWVSRWDVRLIVFSALGSFGVWMYLYDGYIPNLLRLYDERFPIAMLIGSYLVGFKLFDWFRFRLVPLALMSMAGLLIFVLVRNFSSLQDDIWAQFQNLFLGQGFWGSFFIAIVAGLAIIGWKDLDQNYKTIATISLLLVLGSLVAKLLDGGLFGDPTLGRLGWTDSLNRMWLHSFGIFIIMLIIGMSQRIGQKAKVSA